MFTRQLFRNPWLLGAVLLCVLLQLAAVHLPVLQRALRTVPLTGTDWLIVAGLSLLPLLAVETVKLAQRAGHAGEANPTG